MPPLHDLEAAKTTPAQTLFAKKLEGASPTPGRPEAPKPLAGGSWAGLTTWVARNDHGWPHRANAFFLLEPRFIIFLCSAQPHAKTQSTFPRVRGDFSQWWSRSSAGPASLGNTLRCLCQRQGPSQNNSWQDRERVVGLGEHTGRPRSSTRGRFQTLARSLIAVCSRREETERLWSPPPAGCPRAAASVQTSPLGGESGGHRTAGASSLGVGVWRAEGLGEGTGSGSLQWTATKDKTKTRKKTNVTP